MDVCSWLSLEVEHDGKSAFRKYLEISVFHVSFIPAVGFRKLLHPTYNGYDECMQSVIYLLIISFMLVLEFKIHFGKSEKEEQQLFK